MLPAKYTGWVRLTMRTFTEKPKATLLTMPTKPTIFPAHFGRNREANSIFNLQPTSGDQAVQQQLEARAANAPGDSTTTGNARSAHNFRQMPVHTTAEFARSIVMRASAEAMQCRRRSGVGSRGSLARTWAVSASTRAVNHNMRRRI